MARDGLLDKIRELTEAGYEVRFRASPILDQDEDLQVGLFEEHRYIQHIVSREMLDQAYVGVEEVMVYALDYMVHQMQHPRKAE